jgi:hypothetical protein
MPSTNISTNGMMLTSTASDKSTADEDVSETYRMEDFFEEGTQGMPHCASRQLLYHDF